MMVPCLNLQLRMMDRLQQRYHAERQQWLEEGKRQGKAEAQRGYDRRWQKSRLVYLLQYPWYASCGMAADTVDHVITHRGNMDLFWDPSN